MPCHKSSLSLTYDQTLYLLRLVESDTRIETSIMQQRMEAKLGQALSAHMQHMKTKSN